MFVSKNMFAFWTVDWIKQLSAVGWKLRLNNLRGNQGKNVQINLYFNISYESIQKKVNLPKDLSVFILLSPFSQ